MPGIPLEGAPGMLVEPGIPGDPGVPLGPGVPEGVAGMPGSPGKGGGIGGICVPLTETSMSTPSSPSFSSDLLLASPDELGDEELLGIPAVGVEPGLPEEDAVDLELLELEELELDELDEVDGIDGALDREELEAEGIEGELELELDEELDGFEGDELLRELELEEAVGMEGDELELLLWVSVLQAARIRLNADAVINALIGNPVTGLFIFIPLSCARLKFMLYQARLFTGPTIV